MWTNSDRYTYQLLTAVAASPCEGRLNSLPGAVMADESRRLWQTADKLIIKSASYLLRINQNQTPISTHLDGFRRLEMSVYARDPIVLLTQIRYELLAVLAGVWLDHQLP